jgi:hypothetical protein
LAATVLSNVYEFAEILRTSREPWVLPHETAKLDGIPDEVSQNSNYVPERRLLEHQEFFARFRSLKHEYGAVFGKDAAKPFEELWRIRIDINHGVDDMLRNKEMGQSRDPDDIKEWREMYRIAFRDPDETKDEIAKRIATEVAAVEAICRPAIEARTNM